jgi:aldehyde dehydrogenase (NAD+)
LIVGPGKSKIRYEPLGVALIFGSWNYPYVVNLKPFADVIAAGNCCVIKPSEMAPETSSVMKKLVENYLDQDCFAVIEGGVEVAAAICKYPWDVICFTGST